MDRKLNTYKKQLELIMAKPISGLQSSLGKDSATVSKWCTNAWQPSLEMMIIAKLLNVDLNDLVRFEAVPNVATNCVVMPI